MIENVVGRAEPANINVASRTQTRERIFLEELRRQVYEQYRPAFTEVMETLEEKGLHRAELKDAGRANEANRFLNWVRLTYVLGDEAWQSAQLKERDVRRAEIARLGSEWVSTEDHKIPDEYLSWLGVVNRVYGTPGAIASASKEARTAGGVSSTLGAIFPP